MRVSTLTSVVFASLSLCLPVHEKRQLFGGLLGGLFGGAGTSNERTFDYIIVGGGTAGLTIAKRLAEDRTISVAVIEAGGVWKVTDALIAEAPGGDVLFVGTTETFPGVDWGFATPADPASNNKKRSYARGKCLGGSSARNFMIYQRPTVGALQMWADEVDDQDYSWSSFLPYFKKSVDFTPPSNKRGADAKAKYNAAAFDSTGGPLQVSYPTYAQPFSKFVQGSLEEIGIPAADDFNSGKLMGAQYSSATIDPKRGQRESSQTSFLQQATSSGLTNLKVFSSTMAKKILFDSKRKTTGVVIEMNLQSVTLTARKEVILAAGAFQSPQMLMVSGVGPKSQLDRFNIPVVADRPGVGQNLQDHVFFGPSYRVKETTLTKVATNPAFLLAELAKFRTLILGMLTNNVADFLAWEKIPSHLRSSLGTQALEDLAKLPEDWPEVEYLSAAGYVGDFSSLFMGQPMDGYQYATILAAIVAPQSRGNVTLNSKDTKTLPTINMAYLQSPTDQKVAIAAFKRAREAFASNYMKGTVIGTEYYPGPKVQTDEDILKVIKNSLQTVWHASSTCKMGRESDPMAVVDSHARVYGVTGLRVVDASAFPFLPPGHPQSSVYALAEKIADDIKRGE